MDLGYNPRHLPVPQFPSRVAGTWGENGFRVIVSQPWRFAPHVSGNESLYLVPDLEVMEPVEWDDLPSVIAAAAAQVHEIIQNPCGGCTACCRVLYVRDSETDFEVPSGVQCKYCSEQFGCTIHKSRPKVCGQFQCLWLKSQSRNDIMPPELRPDRCGVIFSDDSSPNPDPELFEVHPDKDQPDALSNPLVVQFIDEQQRLMGRKAKLITFYHGEGGGR